MPLNSRRDLIARLRRGAGARRQLIESHIAKGLAYQIRATRDRLGWSQEKLAREVGMNQNAISRLESPDYGKPTLTTLKRIASALDVALVVRFVPFSEFIDWISGTPHTVAGLSTTEALAVPTFEMEEDDGVLQPALAAMSASATPIQDSEEIAQIKVQRGMSAANSQTLMFGQEFSAEPVRRPQIPKSLLLGTPEKAQGVSPWR